MAQEILNNSDGNEQLQFTSHDEWYRSFLANTTQKAVQQHTLRETLLTNYPTVWERVIDPEYPLDVLMIGAGTGGSEAAFSISIKNARGHSGLTNVSLYYEDVSPQMHEQFRATANDLDIFHAVKDFSLQKFEDPQYQPTSADLALAFQMWYYVKGWENVAPESNSLVKFARTIDEKKGVGVLSVHSKDGDLFKVRGERLRALHGHNDLTSDKLLDELQKLGVTFHSETVPAITNISSCFQHNVFDPTNEGKNILSFMLRTPWETLAVQTKNEVKTDIEKLVEKNGAPHLLFKDTYFFIPQQRT